MEWIYGQELQEKEILTNVRPLEDLFSNRYRSGLEDMKKCPDKNIEDVTYEDSCRQAVYNLGPWTAAYLAYKVGNPYVFEQKFYPLLKSLKTMKKHFYRLLVCQLMNFMQILKFGLIVLLRKKCCYSSRNWF